MNPTRMTLHTAATLAALALSLGANAIPISSTSVTWSNAIGGSNIVLNNSNGNYIDVLWGVSTGSGQSGLGFDPSNPPAIDQPVNTPFLLGHLRHYNNPINSGTAASSVDLTLGTAISGASPTTQYFSFRFLIDETLNADPCLYYSTSPCADRITFQNMTLSSSFLFGGVNYTLQLLGFGTSPNALLPHFDSQEEGTNKIGLYAKFTAPPTRVPEPGTLALLSLGLLATGVAFRRKH